MIFIESIMGMTLFKLFYYIFINFSFIFLIFKGRCVDMHDFYQEFMNLKRLKFSEDYAMGDYLWYLQNFDIFHEIPYNLKEKEYTKYRRYLKNTLAYLKDFFKRNQPLADINVLESQFTKDFEFKWKEGSVRGWENKDDDYKNNNLFCKICQKFFTNENVYVV